MHTWKKHSLEGLWELPGRRGKTKWKDEDIVFLKECLKKEARTYNSPQLAKKLESEAPKGAASLTQRETKSRQILRWVLKIFAP